MDYLFTLIKIWSLDDFFETPELNNDSLFTY